METTVPVRVLVADDHPLYRGVLVRAVGAAPALELAGEAGDGPEAARLIDALRPAVALLDVKMPGLGGIELCERLVARGSATRVVMISAYRDPALVGHALRAGAAAFVPKDASLEEMCETLVRVGRGVVAAEVP
jgi:DNA-binding NarL/FixJ family response regulator